MGLRNVMKQKTEAQIELGLMHPSRARRVAPGRVMHWNDYPPHLENYVPSQHFKKMTKFKPSLLRPLFPYPTEYGPLNQRRQRSLTERVHLALSDPESCKFASWFLIFVIVVILVSCTNFVLETRPHSKEYAPGCEQCKPLSGAARLDPVQVAARADLAQQCVGCEPEAHPAFFVVEVMCIAIFTADYLARLCTVHAALTDKERAEGFSYEFPRFRYARRVAMFLKEPLNIVDLISIIPFFVSLFIKSGAKLQIVRMLRLFRVFVIPELGNLSEKAKMFGGMLSNLGVYFAVFLIFSIFAIVVAASVTFYAESGHWDTATGEYLRSTLYPYTPNEPSPFVSIPDTFWWVVVTIATVGYGDSIPSTGLGQAIGGLTMYVGILLVALPITIMGISVSDMYTQQVQMMARKNRVLTKAATAIHTMATGHSRVRARRAWNSWRAFVGQDMTNEGMRKLRNSITSVVTPRVPLDPVSQAIRSEFEGAEAEIMARWRAGIADIVQLLSEKDST